jgi:hypothetical protein
MLSRLNFLELAARQLLMATVTKYLSRGPSQIEPFIAALIPILAVKGMAGGASDPSLVVEKHIGRDLHGRENTHGVRMPVNDVVGSLMAFQAHILDVASEGRRSAQEGQTRVAFNARHVERAVMPEVFSARGGRGERRDKYDDG